jgi:hypothetical protein
LVVNCHGSGGKGRRAAGKEGVADLLIRHDRDLRETTFVIGHRPEGSIVIVYVGQVENIVADERTGPIGGDNRK